MLDGLSLPKQQRWEEIHMYAPLYVMKHHYIWQFETENGLCQMLLIFRQNKKKKKNPS